MKELIDQIIRIRGKCEQYGKELEKELASKAVPNDPRYACFAMIFNRSTLNWELLSYYYRVWRQSHKFNSKSELERLRKENGERCMELTKSLFVDSMSSIEYCAKESIKLYSTSSITNEINKISLTRPRHTYYLSDVIRESMKCELISQQEKEKWDRIIILRNLVVHNNGIADKDDIYVIDGLTVTLKKGTMIQGKLDVFTNLVESSVESYNLWVKNLVKQS